VELKLYRLRKPYLWETELELFHKARGGASEAGAKAWVEGCVSRDAGSPDGWRMHNMGDARTYAARVCFARFNFLVRVGAYFVGTTAVAKALQLTLSFPSLLSFGALQIDAFIYRLIFKQDDIGL